MRTWLHWAGALTLYFAVANAVVAQEGAEVVKQVLDSWKQRRQAIKTVRYKIEGVSIFPKGSLTENTSAAHPRLRTEYPPKDLSYPRNLEYTIDFKSGKIRREQRDHILNIALGAFHPQMVVTLFDGKRVSLYTPREENASADYTPSARQPDLTVYDKGASDSVLSQDDYAVLFAHGYPNVYNKSINALGYFDRSLDSSLFRYHQRAAIGDRTCVILRTVPEVGRLGRFDEFWVDLERDAAILRWQAYKRGAAYIRYEVSLLC